MAAKARPSVAPDDQPDWGALSGGLLGYIGKFACPVSMASARLVCKQWARHMGSLVEAFPKPHAVELSLPANNDSWLQRLTALKSVMPNLAEIAVRCCLMGRHSPRRRRRRRTAQLWARRMMGTEHDRGPLLHTTCVARAASVAATHSHHGHGHVACARPMHPAGPHIGATVGGRAAPSAPACDD